MEGVVLKEVTDHRREECVCVEFGRMGPMYWVWGRFGKQAIPREVGEQMIREGAPMIKIVK